MEILGVGEFLPSSWFMDLLADMFCDEGFFQGICTNIIFLMVGYNEEQMNETLLPTILKHTPAGASTKQIIHYAQEVNSANFAMYDFGSEDNMQIYGQTEPLNWHVKDVNLPVSTYWGVNDWLGAEEVNNLLKHELIKITPSSSGGLEYSTTFCSNPNTFEGFKSSSHVLLAYILLNQFVW
jgi:lysosomal acid lipase/cholesteryl ester hydrolase